MTLEYGIDSVELRSMGCLLQRGRKEEGKRHKLRQILRFLVILFGIISKF